MRNVALIVITFGLLQSCCNKRKASADQHVYVVPDLPYMALNKKALDTTFDYQVLDHPIYDTLPNRIFKTRVTGAVEFYSVIDESKNVTDVKLISAKFYKRKHLVYTYNPEQGNRIDKELINYLFVEVKS